MPSTNVVRIYSRSWRFVLLMSLGGCVLALALSLAQPLRYSSSVRLLITQTNVAGVDPYTAVKSTERIAQNLSEIVYTSSFFNAVMKDGTIDRTYFTQDEITKRKKWKDSVETQVTPGTGVMSVVAYHPNREQATALAIHVAQEMSDEAPNYFGYSVRVQVIDDPLPSRFFAKPDFVSNALFGAIVGFLFASAWVLGRVRDV